MKKILKNMTALLLAAALLLPVSPTAYAVEEHVCGIGDGHTHDECDEDAVPTEITVFGLKQYAASTVAVPDASKESGTISCASDSTSVKLSAQSGATIYYSLNGGDYKKYSSAIKLTKNSTLKAYAKKNGSKSKTITFEYTLKPSKSAINFKATDTAGGKLVKITSDISNLKIYYTTDGSKPTTKSKAYPSGGITLTKSCTLRVLVKKSGWDSTSISKEYTVKSSSGSSSSGSSSSSSGSSSGSAGSSSSSSGKVVTKETQTVECKHCYGTKNCKTCYGLGIKVFGILRSNCDSCDATGVCAACGGKGKGTATVNVINENAVPEGKRFVKCTSCNGLGTCSLCGGLKLYHNGKDCVRCNGTGTCTGCDGSGGELRDEPEPGTGSSSGSISPGSSGLLNICFACNGTGSCNICHGSNLCQVCFGKGGKSVPTYGQGGSGWVTCTGCNGNRRCKYCNNGRCKTCGGTGKRY